MSKLAHSNQETMDEIDRLRAIENGDEDLLNGDNFHIKLCDNKYTYVRDEKGHRVLRYGEEWRDITGDKFVWSIADMAYEQSKEIERLNQKINELQKLLDCNYV